MKRGSYRAVAARNGGVLARIRELKAEHPFWGFRRIWAHLKYIDGMAINKKRVYRLMKDAGLLAQRNERLKALRTSRPKPRPTRPNQWWGIDMTKVMIAPEGWVYVVIVIDWHTKKVVGHYAGAQSKSWHWLIALNRAVNRQFPRGIRETPHHLHLMSDNGCQPTSEGFMRAAASLGIKQAFTSYNNPKGNADTERFMRTLKEELVWINEWTSHAAFEQALDRWIEHYNKGYLHSALGYKPPEIFESECRQNTSLNTPLKYAC